jgi:hypothetical protein
MLKQIATLTIFAITLAFVPATHADASLPDLTVTQFYVPARDTFAGSPYNAQDMRVKVENIGLGTAAGSRLDLVIADADGATVCVGRGKDLPEMPAYETREYTLDRFEFFECPALAAGTYTLSAVADRNNVISESHEDNNAFTKNIAVLAASDGVVLSDIAASVSSVSAQQVKINYRAGMPTTNSWLEYASEVFYEDAGHFDINQNVTSFDNQNYSATITITPEVPYRYRAVAGDSNVQTQSQIFILMKEALPSVLEFTDLVEVIGLSDTAATIRWHTTQLASTTVVFEAGNANVNGESVKTVSAEQAALDQSVTLTNLKPDTKYYFKMTAASGAATADFISFFQTQKTAYSAQTIVEPVTPPAEETPATSTPPVTETPVATCDFATPGSLIKTAGASAVYYYGNDCKAYVFPNEKTYFTWYDDFSSVAVIPDASMAQISLGGNVTYRPGIKMIKMQSSPNVYIIAKGGSLHLVQDEAQAISLYGSDWNTKIDDVAPAFFTDYEVGTPVANVNDFEPQTLQAQSTSINEDKAL